eukprot:Pompholyxophrys_punicea_v1_NODE_1785_length_552_cov_4.557344.p2 type:complete len:112 gc:universal NODE_1785_length_552_cov_4.557344:83-418(+)
MFRKYASMSSKYVSQVCPASMFCKYRVLVLEHKFEYLNILEVKYETYLTSSTLFWRCGISKLLHTLKTQKRYPHQLYVQNRTKTSSRCRLLILWSTWIWPFPICRAEFRFG